MAKFNLKLLIVLALISSCSKNNPSELKIKKCLIKSLGEKVEITSLENIEGVTLNGKEFNTYMTYFDSEIKFQGPIGAYKEGDVVEIEKGLIYFEKHKSKWKCANLDIYKSKITEKIGSTTIEISGEEFDRKLTDKYYNKIQTSNAFNSNFNNRQNTIKNYDNNALRFGFVSQRKIIASELSTFTNWELRLMRNEIFAKYGYIFRSDDLRSYFNQQTWYHPQYADVSGWLTPLEKENVAIIKYAEKQRGIY